MTGARTDEENEAELIGSRALRGAIAGSWLVTALATAVCAATFRALYPGWSSLALVALVLVAGSLLVARRAAQKQGAWGAVLAAVACAGCIPSFVAVSLYGATRPLMACEGIVGVDCYPTYATVGYVGAGTTVVPLLLSTIAAGLLAKRRRRPVARLLPVAAALALVVATFVALVAGSRGLRFIAADRYLDSPTELGRLAGTKFALVRTKPRGLAPPADAAITSGSSPLLAAKWSQRTGMQPCELAIGGGSYSISSLGLEKNAVTGDDEAIVCPAVRVRQDASRNLLVIDAARPDGGFRPAFSVRSEGASGNVSGPLYVDSWDLPRVAPARAWVILAVAGVLAALGLVFARLRRERDLVARWRASAIGTHRGDGWIAFEEGATAPLHLASAQDLPRGEVRVLGIGEPSETGYRASTVTSSSEAVAGILADVERDARERTAATVVVAGIVAFIAATPVASALFVMSL